MADEVKTTEDILRILPHRFPFLLVDKVISTSPVSNRKNFVGRKIEAVKNVTMNEPFFPGHFPRKPIMPGVLIVEALAQAAAILAHRPPSPGTKMDVLIVGVDNARFRQPVLPGDTLHLFAEVVRDRGSIIAFHTEAKVNGAVVAEADILAKQFPSQEQ